MVMENLGSSLRDTLKKIARANRIDEKTLNEVVKDIQRRSSAPTSTSLWCNSCRNASKTGR